MKIGIWKYNLINTKHEVLWDTYNNPLKKILINYPHNWVIFKKRIIMISLLLIPSNSNNASNQYFVIIAQHVDSMSLSTKEYKNKLVEMLNRKDKIVSHVVFQISNSNRVGYFLRYEIIRNGNNMILYDYIGEVNKRLMDFAFLTQNENNEIKDEVFFGLISGCYFDNERVLDPFKETTVKKID